MKLRYKAAVERDCPHCGTTHHCRVEGDEDGLFAEIETKRCHDDGCRVRLCSECPQFVCECGLDFCREHGAQYGDMLLCPVCKALEEAQALAIRSYDEATAL